MAEDCYERSVTLARKLNHYREADTLTRLGDSHQAAGDLAAARAAWHRALSILTDLNHPDADNVRAKLGRGRDHVRAGTRSASVSSTV